MTLPRTVSDVVAEHTVFQIECIDRMYLNVYVPQLQYPAGIVGLRPPQLGLPIASTAPLGKITDAFSTAVRRFAFDEQVPWVDFAKGQRKDEVMHRTSPGSRHLAGPRECCSWAVRRRRPPCFAPRSAVTRRARRTRGS
jgi:hypothetical protein